MIKFRCYQTPIEHLKNWLQEEHELPTVVENIAEVARSWLNMDIINARENLPNQKYFERAKAYLAEKGEHDAIVYLLRSPIDNKILHGSTRIPLKVKTPEDVYIIKPYDMGDSDLEKKVLQTVGGKIAPEVLHLGEEFYSEELVDFSRYMDLYHLCLATGAFNQDQKKELWDHISGKDFSTTDLARQNQLMNTMIEAAKPLIIEGAKIHAALAKLGVIYNHNHWLDEFHVSSEDKSIITDFGTAYFFLHPEQVAEELPLVSKEFETIRKEYLDPLAFSNGDGKGLTKKLIILAFKKQQMELFQVKHDIGSNLWSYIFDESSHKLSPKGREMKSYLVNDPALAANLHCVMYTALPGMKRLFESLAVGSCNDYVSKIYSDFSAAFVDAYFS